MRYVDGNALRAGLVVRAEDWPWGSLALRTRSDTEDSSAVGSLRLPRQWVGLVNAAKSMPELEDIRHAVRCGAPYGAQDWVSTCAAELGLEHTLRRRGRPRRAGPEGE
jgi:putative transposase